MIKAVLSKDGRTAAVLVMEPGNIAKLEAGQPIVLKVDESLPLDKATELIIMFTPDVNFVADAVQKSGDLITAVEQSMLLPMRYRPSDDCEKVIKAL